MSMKKILMAAAAVTALTAGSANAASITSAQVSGVNLTQATQTAAAKSYVLADSVVLATAANVTTATGNTVKAKLGTAGYFAPGPIQTTYTATYTLSGTGNPVFTTTTPTATLTAMPAVTIAGVTVTCTPPTVSAVGGGASGSNSVTFAFTMLPGTGGSACNNQNSPTEFVVDAPFKLTSVGSVTASIGFKVASTEAAYDGAAATYPLVITASPYTVAVTADTVPTVMALTAGSAGYVSLKTSTDNSFDSNIGKLTAAAATAPANAENNRIYQDLTGGTTALPAITADVALIATSGNFSVIVPKIGTSTTGVVSPTNSSSFTDKGQTLAADTSVSVSIATNNTTQINSAQSYTATVTPKLAANTTLTTPAAIGPVALQTINLEGINFIAPWIAGSQSPSNVLIRIANNSGTDAGAITLNLKSPIYNTGTAPTVAPTACTSAKLPALAKIAAGTELVLGATELTTCFGDFKRGDLLITAQAPKDNLTAKARLTTASGQVSEISLGGLNTGTLAY
jgi:hypothetical protein